MIACLGWGSLIWNSEGLPAEGGWNADGPPLPVEYTRVSGGGRLTLVITEGAPAITVFWSRLSVTSIDDAIQVLAVREGVSQQNMHRSIGVWSAARSSDYAQAAMSAVGLKNAIYQRLSGQP